jgi:hypothetical protein
MKPPGATRHQLPAVSHSGTYARFVDPASNFWRSWRIALGQSGVWHLAAFLDGLPSKGQEIDDKLQSNSR